MNQEQVLKTAPNWKYWILFGVIAALALVMFLVPPIPQSQTYHLFADTRSTPIQTTRDWFGTDCP